MMISYLRLRDTDERRETRDERNSREQQGLSCGHLLVSEHVVLVLPKAAPAPSSAANAADRSMFRAGLDLIGLDSNLIKGVFLLSESERYRIILLYCVCNTEERLQGGWSGRN